jgi:hypothetical protein
VAAGLPRDSVLNVTALAAIDNSRHLIDDGHPGNTTGVAQGDR